MTKHHLVKDFGLWLRAQPFARGGIADGSAGVIANTVAAVDRAIDAGHGVVLEVQLSFDGDAIVFCEATLDRLTSLTGHVLQYSSAQLQAQQLKGSDENISSLSYMLLHIAGQIPVIIDARRPPKDPYPLCFAIRRALEGYGGPVGVMALDPRIISWFKINSRRVARGLVITDRKQWLPWWARLKLWRHYAVRKAQPDFFAIDLQSLPSDFATGAKLDGYPTLAWTVRTDADRALASTHTDNYIYETGDQAAADAGQSRR